VLVGLNKGETLHSMARTVSFGRQGRFADRGYEAQLNRASAPLFGTKGSTSSGIGT
jgi:TnpA family transposase